MGTGGKAGVHGLIGDFLVRIGGRQILLPSVDKRGEEHGAESGGAHGGAKRARNLGLDTNELGISQPKLIDPRTLFARRMKLISSMRGQ